MSQIIINTGNIANDGTGDPLRTAFNETNNNFSQIFSAGPVGSNIAIANNTIQVTNTNGNLKLATNGIGVIVPASNFVPDIPNARYIGTATNRFNTVFSQYFDANSATLNGNLYVGGNLNVVGNTITNNYSNANIANLTLTLAGGSSNAALANGAGILVNSANANFVYNNSANSWNSTIAITAPTFIGDGSNLTNVNATVNAINLVGNTLRSSVIFSNLTSFGSVIGISATGNISTTGNVYANVITGNVINGTFAGNGSGLTNLTANAIVGNVPFALNANSAYTANLAALATQAINADTALFAINANLAAFANVATSAQTANTASYSVQSDNANSAVVAGMAYEIAPTANISVVGNITTSGYFIGNGSQLTGITATAITGNIGFDGDTIYDLNGINLQNSDLTHGPTAAIIIPANGDTDPILLNNIYGNVILQSGANGAPTATWLFNNDGNLTLPSNIASINYANGQPYGGSGGNANTGNVTFDNINIIGTGNLHLQPDPANAGSYLDVFLTSGPDLHLVASANANLILGKDDTSNVRTSWDGNVTVQSWNLNTGNSGGTWTFGGDGGTIFPTLTTQRGDNPSGTITGQTLLFGDNSQEAVISTPDGNVTYPSSQRLVINPGEGFDGGEGGDIYLWAGRGGNNSGSGGDVKIRGGQGLGQYGAGGYLRIQAGDSQDLGDAGFIEITAGQGGNTYGGMVAITGGQGGNGSGGDVALNGGYGAVNGGGDVTINGGASGLGLADYGNIYIGSGASTWVFDSAGNLTLPGNIFAVNYANGDPIVISGGGNANTGNITFDVTNISTDLANADITITGNGSGAVNIVTGANGYTQLQNDSDTNGSSYVWLEDGNVYIESNGGEWTFDSTGNLSATGNITGSFLYGDGSNLTNLPINNLIANGNSYANIPTTNGNLDINANGNQWKFGTDGTTFFPDGTNFGEINGANTIGFAVNPGSDFTIDAGGTWIFGTDGNTTLPNNVSAAGNINGNSFVLHNAGNLTYSSIQRNQNPPYGGQAFGIELLTTTDDPNVFSSVSSGPDYVALLSTNAGNANVIVQGGYGVTISTSNATGADINEWSFVASGDTFFPGALSTVSDISTTGNVLSQGEVSAVGNITTDGYFIGTFIGNVTGNFVIPGANTQVVFNTDGNADATGGMTFVKGPNLFTVLGTVSAQGNVLAGNILTSNIISAGGNITSNANVITVAASGGNGAAINGAGIVAGANIASILYDNSVFGWTVNEGWHPAANVTYNLGRSNRYWNNFYAVNLNGVDQAMSGYISAVGNIYGGNIIGNGIISTTGNITAPYFIGSGSQLTNLPAPSVTQDITSNGYMSLMTYDGNIKYVSYATVEPSSGNLHVAGNISAVGNISANNIGNITTLNLNGDGNTVLYGNGIFAAATGGGSSNIIYNGLSNVSIPIANNIVQINVNDGSGSAASVEIDQFLNINLNFNDNAYGYLGFDGNNDFHIADVIDGGNIFLQTQTSASEIYTWILGANGYLTFPRDTSNVSTDPYLQISGGGDPTIISSDVSQSGPANLAIVSNYLHLSGYTGNAVSIYADNGEIATSTNLVLTANAAGNTTSSWTFGSTGNLLLAPQNVSGNIGESAIVAGTRKIINGQYSGASYGYSAVLATGGTPTVAYKATNEYVQSVRLTFAVESIGVAPQWEQFDVVATKSLDVSGGINFVVSNRIKARSSIPDTVVTAAFGSANEIEISLTLDAGQTGGWSSFDAVEFGLMFN